jgi:hypothetical protein
MRLAWIQANEAGQNVSSVSSFASPIQAKRRDRWPKEDFVSARVENKRLPPSLDADKSSMSRKCNPEKFDRLSDGNLLAV